MMNSIFCVCQNLSFRNICKAKRQEGGGRIFSPWKHLRPNCSTTIQDQGVFLHFDRQVGMKCCHEKILTFLTSLCLLMITHRGCVSWRTDTVRKPLIISLEWLSCRSIMGEQMLLPPVCSAFYRYDVLYIIVELLCHVILTFTHI